MDLSKLGAERQKLIGELESIHAQCEGRVMEAGEKAEWETRSQKLAEIDGILERERFLEEKRRGLDEVNPPKVPVGHNAAMPTADEYRDAFWKYFARPFGGRVDNDVLDIIERGFVAAAAETRAVVTNSDASGGYTVPEGNLQPIVEAQEYIGGVMAAPGVTVIRTTGGEELPIPEIDERAEEGETKEEAVAATEGSLSFERQYLRSYVRDSKYIKVSAKFLRETALPQFENWLLGALAQRLFRKRNDELTNGTGNNEPYGVAVGAYSAATAASATVVTYSELLSLYIAVDRGRRDRGAWMMNDTTYGEILDLVDGAGRHYFIDAMGNPANTILRRPIVINPDMPNTAASQKAILFGDFSAYWARLVGGDMRLLRSDQRFWEERVTAFMAEGEWDGTLVDAGDHPIQCITMHA